jgi:transcription elongation factor GreA
MVDAKRIPDNVGRCGFCGGGRADRPKVKNEELTHQSTTLRRGLRHAVVVEPPERVDALGFGRAARVLDQELGMLHTWTIVRPSEADVENGKLSAESPVAKALLGRVAGETVVVQTPRGPRRYTVQELVS